jgi:hypothetical protein
MVWFYYAVKRNIAVLYQKGVMKEKKVKIFFVAECGKKKTKI